MNVFAQKSLLSSISPIILKMPPSYLAWFHKAGVSSPKNSSLLDQGKRTLRGEAVQALLIPSKYEYERSEIWEGWIVVQKEVTVSALPGAKRPAENLELLQYRADHCTKQVSDYFIMIQRETLITSRWRSHRTTQWWRVCSVGDPRWWKLSMKLCRHLNMTQSWSLLRKEAGKKLGLIN